MSIHWKKKLKQIGYYEKYRQVYFDKSDDNLSKIYGKFEGGYLTLPEGMAGSDLLEMRKKLQEEYKKIECGTGETEIKKRGADCDITETKL